MARNSTPEAGERSQHLQLAARAGQHGGNGSGARRRLPRTRPSASREEAFSSGVPTVTRIAVRRAEPVQRPHDHPLAQQRSWNGARVLAELDVDEVADRARHRVQPVRARGRPRARRAPSAFSARRRAISSASARLASAASCATVETSNGAPHLRIAVTTARRRDGVADAQPGEAVDLRERAQDDDLPALLEVLLDRVRVVGVVDVLEVRLVDDRERRARARARRTRPAPRACSSSRSGCSAWQT